MKRWSTFAGGWVWLALFPAINLWADDLPKPVNFSRYQAMMDRSPFAIATAAAPVVSTASFAKDLYIANAATSPEGDMVTLASSSDKNFKKYLTTKAPVDGFSISNIEWSDKVGATKVTISKDGQFASLTFNQALLSQPVANSQPNQQSVVNMPVPTLPQPQQNFPGTQQGVPSATGGIRPAPIPTLPTPPPRIRGVIPRNPAANQNIATPAPEP
jgi:hypothetical protein